jgi:hypothetical protein
MKVGILSLTSGYNFGGTLQTVALARTLEHLGHQPVVIDYWPVKSTATPIWRGWGLRQTDRAWQMRRRIGELRHLGPFQRKYHSYKRAYISWTEPCVSRVDVERAIEGMDAVVVGSDQVWNLGYHPDPVFMLDGLDSFKGLRIAYAACCGNPAQACAPWVRSALSRFDAVSVRNEFTAGWVRRCTGGMVDPAVVCDPTLLSDDYPRRNLPLPEKYIAAYHIGDPDPGSEARFIRMLREKHGEIPVLGLMATATKTRVAPWHDKHFWRLDPFEWVEAIRSASVVFTDSYHAILFALRYQIPLLATYTEKVRAPRLIELRDSLELHGCILHSSHDHELDSRPSLEDARSRLLAQRDSSLAFLRESLAGSL